MELKLSERIETETGIIVVKDDKAMCFGCIYDCIEPTEYWGEMTDPKVKVFKSNFPIEIGRWFVDNEMDGAGFIPVEIERKVTVSIMNPDHH